MVGRGSNAQNGSLSRIEKRERGHVSSRWIQWILSFGPWVVAAWVSLALLGYGLALQDYRGKAVGVAAPLSFRLLKGDVDSFSTEALPRKGIRITLVGQAGSYFVPSEYVVREEGWSYINEYLKKGVGVALAVQPDSIVVGLGIFPDGHERAAIRNDETQKLRSNESVWKHGRHVVWMGLLSFPALLIGLILVLKPLRRMGIPPRP
jgi:hypothetical protein